MLIFVDGDDITVEPMETVREVLRLASDASDKAKFDRVLVSPKGEEFISLSMIIRPCEGDRWTTRRRR